MMVLLAIFAVPRIYTFEKYDLLPKTHFAP